ncbi:hypothetical protein [Eubacterium oxidoreducens]|uniref:Peptidase_C39 like family protein n=1 Tax=Eubacterium oxidoreducens TaxID=1732 RepID=A0A1G6BSQ7_EUBOX|nr:hypothetical protein [Eubacterium oxidoreducens]SDB23660.1 hypothetical protein SAMN02910417_01770 [Eubacterium oxidoreducens]
MNKRNIKLFITGIVILLVAGAVFLGMAYVQEQVKIKSQKNETKQEVVQEEDETLEESDLAEELAQKERTTYTFLQGPKSWAKGLDWSGEWAQEIVNGNAFGSFGCGLCAMANIYDTLSPYEVSPLKMCTYAQKVSGYTPTAESGAIGWGDMKTVLKSVGMDVEVSTKPDNYEDFCENLKNAQSAIVLVCSADDDSYWEDTPGHYVNIWHYNEEENTVFLADPGGPSHNRDRIDAKYVYDAMKTSSKFQVLYVWSYDEEDNSWKADGIKDEWNRPDYL